MPNSLDRSFYLLRLIFVVATALIFFLMGLTYKHLDRLSEVNAEVNRSFDISLKLEELYANVKTLETQRRNLILTRDPHYNTTIIVNKDRLLVKLRHLHDLSSPQKQRLENFEILNALIHEKIALVLSTMDGSTDLDSPGSLSRSLTKGNALMTQIVNQIETMLDLEKQHLNKHRADQLFSQQSTPIYLYLISLFSLGLLAFAFYKINKDFRTQKLINQELELSIDTLGLAEKVGNNGTWTFDLNSRVLKFSSNLYKMLGIEPNSNPTLDLFLEHVHPEDKRIVTQKFNELKVGKNVAAFRYRIISEDGQQRQYQSLGRKVKTNDDEMILVVITTDFTREFEDQLKLEGINYVLTERNKKLSVANESYLEAEKIGYFGTWQFFYKEKEFVFSENFLRLFGLEPEEFSQQVKHLLPFVHSEDRDLVAQVFQKVFDGREFEPFVSRIIPHGHHQIRYITTTGKRIRNPFTGDYLLVITQDVTDEYLIKQDLEQNNVILEANNKELQAFNYAASHDLQEPLRKIETFLSRLRDTNYSHLTESGQQYMDRTLVAANRMRSLIDDLLHFSRSTRSEANFEKADLNILMQNALESLAHLIEEKKAKIHVAPLPILHVIPFQIQQMFVNLIGNSLKYSKEGTLPVIDISCSNSSSDKEAVIRNEVKTLFYKLVFRDNGIGFENQYSEKIFNLFNRLHSREHFQGTGIGLAICKKIVENHGGYIYAQGEPGEGAVFTILLPMEP